MLYVSTMMTVTPAEASITVASLTILRILILIVKRGPDDMVNGPLRQTHQLPDHAAALRPAVPAPPRQGTSSC